MNSHRLRADGTIRPNEVAHRINNFAINHIDRSDLNNASLQTAGFCIYYAQHAMLLAEND
jgi:hypothetical protein